MQEALITNAICKESAVKSKVFPHRINVESLTPNDSGHFTSNYVCVISIDDGRIFIDYHYSDNPMKYGIGRLFSHSWIIGVNYSEGKYIKGGKDRLTLLALYDCNSKDEAIEVFNSVLLAYKQEYGDKVFSNKGQKEKKQKENPNILYYENSSLLYLFPYYEDPIQFESLDEFIHLSSQLPPKGFRVKMNLNSHHHIPNANYILGEVDSYGSSRINFVFKSVNQIDTIEFRSRNGAFSMNHIGMNRPTHAAYYISAPGFYDESLPEQLPMKDQYEQLIRVLDDSAVQVVCNGDAVVSITDQIINKFSAFLKVSLFLLEKTQSSYFETRNKWFEKESFKRISESEADSIVSLIPTSVELTVPTASMRGFQGEIIHTTPYRCSCFEYVKSDYDKTRFVPCVHMRWLVQKAGMLDHIVFPDCYDPIIEMIRSKSSGDYSGYSSCFKTEVIDGWKKPLITFRDDIVITDIHSEEKSRIKIWLNRHNIIVDTDSPFYNGYGGTLFLNGNYIGTIFHDIGDSGYYKIENAATVSIYETLLSGKPFDIRLQMKYGEKKPYSIHFPATVGFADYYRTKYDDAVVKYKIMLRENKGLKKECLFSKQYKLKKVSFLNR